MKHIVSFFGAVSLVMALMVSTAFAQVSNFTLFGETSYAQPGYDSLRAVEMVSDSDPGYGGVDIETPEDMTFAELTYLAADYKVTEGACGGGSPRFQINIVDPDDPEQAAKNLFVYIGQEPSFTCTPNIWHQSGDLVETGKFVDATQAGGMFYEPYDSALLHFGHHVVTGIQLVTDAGWMFDNNQIVQADNIRVNDMILTFEPTREEAKETCKQNGYTLYTGENGLPGPFKNQGHCVSYFNRAL